MPRVVRLLASGVNPNRGQGITPASCEAWLRKVAGCDHAVRDWILRDATQRFVYLNPLGEVWGKVQHYMVQQNFRVLEGYILTCCSVIRFSRRWPWR